MHIFLENICHGVLLVKRASVSAWEATSTKNVLSEWGWRSTCHTRPRDARNSSILLLSWRYYITIISLLYLKLLAVHLSSQVGPHYEVGAKGRGQHPWWRVQGNDHSKMYWWCTVHLWTKFSWIFADMFSYGRIQGYVLCITESDDKQGFPMKQGILTNGWLSRTEGSQGS